MYFSLVLLAQNPTKRKPVDAPKNPSQDQYTCIDPPESGETTKPQKMGGKRKKSENEGMEGDNDSKNSIKKMKNEKSEILPSSIKNKEKRSAVHAKLKHQKKLEKRKKLKARDATEKRALELGEEVFLYFLSFSFLIFKGANGC